MKNTIGQFASRPVHTVEVHAKVLSALRLMSEHSISCVVILDQGEAVGILTERDVVFAANWVLGQPDLMIREVMNKPVLTASQEMTVSKAYEVFRDHHIRHLVVLDDRLDLAGIFTQTDLVRALREEAFGNIPDISGLMSCQVLHVAPDVPARYALSQMARRAVSCVIVVDKGRPVGVFSERDVVRLIVEGVDLNRVEVGMVMNASLVTTEQATPPLSAVSLMRKRSVRRLVVLDQVGEMVGILTQTDIGRALERPVQSRMDPVLAQSAMSGVSGSSVH